MVTVARCFSPSDPTSQLQLLCPLLLPPPLLLFLSSSSSEALLLCPPAQMDLRGLRMSVRRLTLSRGPHLYLKVEANNPS